MRRAPISLSLIAALSVVLAIACSEDSAPTPPPDQPAPEPTAQPTIDPDAIVLSWSRAGGIAGFCDGLRLTAGHAAILGTCEDPPMDTPTGDLMSNEAIREFEAWRTEFDSFEVEWDDGPDVADGLTIRLAFVGRGSRQATESVQQEIAEFAAQVFTETRNAQPRARSPRDAVPRPAHSYR